MITEPELISEAKRILDIHIPGKYKLVVVGRKKDAAITMMVTMAVVCKEGLITNDLILELIDEEVRKESDISLVETRLNLDNLDSEILLLEAEVTYSKD